MTKIKNLKLSKVSTWGVIFALLSGLTWALLNVVDVYLAGFLSESKDNIGVDAKSTMGKFLTGSSVTFMKDIFIFGAFSLFIGWKGMKKIKFLFTEKRSLWIWAAGFTNTLGYLLKTSAVLFIASAISNSFYNLQIIVMMSISIFLFKDKINPIALGLAFVMTGMIIWIALIGFDNTSVETGKFILGASLGFLAGVSFAISNVIIDKANREFDELNANEVLYLRIVTDLIVSFVLFLLLQAIATTNAFTVFNTLFSHPWFWAILLGSATGTVLARWLMYSKGYLMIGNTRTQMLLKVSIILEPIIMIIAAQIPGFLGANSIFDKQMHTIENWQFIVSMTIFTLSAVAFVFAYKMNKNSIKGKHSKAIHKENTDLHQ